MNIVYLCPSNSQGLRDYASSLATAVAAIEGVNVTLVVNEEFETNARLGDVKVRRVFKSGKFNPINLLLAIRELGRRTDVVHLMTPNFPLMLMFMLGLKPKGAATILTPHSVKSHWRRPLYDRLQGKIWSAFDALVVGTQADVEIVRSAHGASVHVAQIPHGTYSTIVQPDATPAVETPSSTDGYLDLLFFGYIREDKGLPVLLDAVRLAVSEGLKVRLTVCGQNRSGMDLEAAVEARGLSQAVRLDIRFVPNSDVAGVFKAADAVVLPYDSISESGVLHIAAAMGVPMIASDLAGFKERLREEAGSSFFRRGDPVALKSAIEDLAREYPQRRAKALAGIEAHERAYAWEDIASKTLALYKDASARREQEMAG